MKRLLILFLFFFFISTNKILSQIKAEPLLFKIYYSFRYQYDKEDTSGKFNTEMLLQVGKTKSKFCNAIYDFTDPLPDFVLNPHPPPVNPDINNTVDEPANESAAIDLKSRVVAPEFLYRMAEKNIFVLIATLGYNDFRVETPVPEIKWEITNEIKKIDSISCQKAIGAFGGRIYTVWFAPSIPFPYGPWKLGGLPGLILEAIDSKNEVQYIYKKTELNPSNQFLYFDELRPTLLNEIQYEKTKAKFYKDPIAMSKAQLSSNTNFVEISFYDENGITLKGKEAMEAIKRESKIIITNPLELKKEK